MELQGTIAAAIRRVGPRTVAFAESIGPSLQRIVRTLEEAEAKIHRLRDDIESAGEEAFFRLPPLEPQDHLLIGHVIQVMNYVDMNARRAIEIIDACHADGRKTPEPRDNALLATLSARLEGSPLPESERIECQERLAHMRHLQPVRNHIAHWMARRAVGADAIIVFTKNMREGSRRSGFEPAPFGAVFAVIPLPETRSLLNVVIGHEAWLAHRVADWHLRYVATVDSEPG